MKTILISGISGCGINEYIENLLSFGKKKSKFHFVHLNFGKYMYDVDPEKGKLAYSNWEEGILRRSNSLDHLRNAAFEQVIQRIMSYKSNGSVDGKEVIVLLTTHATFWYGKTLLTGLDFYKVSAIAPDMFITIIDDVINIWECLQKTKQERWEHFSPIDILEWREIETFVTEQMATALGDKAEPKPFFVISKRLSTEILYKVITNENLKKYYRSYPISFVQDRPEVKTVADELGKKLEEIAIVFDPMGIKDYDRKKELKQKFEDWYKQKKGGDPSSSWDEIDHHLSEQTVSRDHRLIDQSDGIVVYYPELIYHIKREGDYDETKLVPFSSGVLDEMQYAIQKGKTVLLVWTSQKDAGPFLRKIFTKDFSCVSNLLDFLKNGIK